MNYVLSGVVLWPKVKFFINIPMKIEKILFFGMLFWTRSVQKVSSCGKNQFHLKHSFILLLFNYHKTPELNYQILQKMAGRLAPYQPVAIAMEKKNFHPNFNILSCFIIWHKIFSPMWTWLQEKNQRVTPLNCSFRCANEIKDLNYLKWAF